MNSRFKVEKSAGLYWLRDTEQEPGKHKKPLPMDSIGMEIFMLLEQGKDIRRISEFIAGRYCSKPEDVLKDIVGFEKRLQNYGYKPGNKEAE